MPLMIDNDNDNEFIFQFVKVAYMNTIYKYIYEWYR